MDEQKRELVTIAIPAYKADFLCDAISSALNQSYPFIELLIIDDDSPYDINGIVCQFHDNRIRYCRNKTNLGSESVAHNWNKCLDEAKGEYFVLLCDDDILQPNMVSSMLVLAEKYPECGMFHANRSVLKKSGEQYEDMRWPQEENYTEYVERKFGGQRKHTITEFFYKTEFLRREKYAVFPVGFYSDDVTILHLCKLQGKMVSCDEPLVLFRESDVHITGNDRYAEGKLRAFMQFYRYLQTDPLLRDRISKEGYECIASQYLMHCDKKTIITLLPLLPKSRDMLKTALYLLLKR